MPVQLYLTRMLVRHLDIPPELAVEASNLEELLDEVDNDHHGFRDSVCDESGRIRKFVNVFLNGQLVAGPDAAVLSTPLSEGDEVYILASVAGGIG